MKTLITIGLCIISTLVLAQKMPSDYFEEGITFYDQERYNDAENAFRYIVINHPKSKIYYESLFNLGYSYLNNHKADSAIYIFKKMLASGAVDLKEVRGDIMESPYRDYKHKSSRILSSIYYDKQKYDSALHFLILSDTVYPYHHFCGNEYAGNTIETCEYYADIYLKMGDTNKALHKLLSIPIGIESLAGNKSAMKMINSLLIKRPDRKLLASMLDTSIMNIKAIAHYYEKDTSFTYNITFLDTKIEVEYYRNYRDPRTTPEIDLVKNYIHNSIFYEAIALASKGKELPNPKSKKDEKTF
ncbi:MAG: hypothetical protein JST70_00310 [Bacteroidetes bacterium]|nr:hypothetical protein [Bacteroidota bacterium]